MKRVKRESSTKKTTPSSKTRNEPSVTPVTSKRARSKFSLFFYFAARARSTALRTSAETSKRKSYEGVLTLISL